MDGRAYQGEAFGNDEPLELVESREPESLRLAVIGELDLDSGRYLADRLDALARDRADVVLDLSRVSFMDSSGLSVLIRAFQGAASDGWSLRVDPNTSEQVTRLLELTGVNGMFWD